MAMNRRNNQLQYKSRSIWLVTIVLASILTAACAAKTPEKRGAVLFAHGLISTGSEYGVTFSPEASAMYFTRNDTVYWSKKGEDGWEPAQLTEFGKGAWVADYLDNDRDMPEFFSWDPVISPDGSKLYFMSHGLVDGKIPPKENAGIDLWVMDRIGPDFADTAWGPPRPLSGNINSSKHTDGAAGVTRDGTIYFFSSNRDDSFGSGDIYVAEPQGNDYAPAVNISPVLNTENFDGHTYLDPDERFMLYISVDRPEGFGGCDIYVTYKSGSEWGEPVNLGPKVNSELCELTPSLSPDGTVLFFSRIEDRDTDERNIYSIKLEETGFSAPR